MNRVFNRFDDIKSLPRFQQTQKSLSDQLTDLIDVANRLGLHDAADFIRSKIDDGK
jgi:hypothetical protein